MGIETSDTELVKFGGANNCINTLDLGSHQAKHSSQDFKVIKIRSFVKKYATISTFANKPAVNALRTNNKPICLIPLEHASGHNWHE